MNLDELRSSIEHDSIDTVVLAIPDMQGRLQGKRLHAQYADVAKEPLPERWRDLVKILGEKENYQSRASGLQRRLGEMCHPRQCSTRNIGWIARRRRAFSPKR